MDDQDSGNNEDAHITCPVVNVELLMTVTLSFFFCWPYTVCSAYHRKQPGGSKNLQTGVSSLKYTKCLQNNQHLFYMLCRRAKMCKKKKIFKTCSGKAWTFPTCYCECTDGNMCSRSNKLPQNLAHNKRFTLLRHSITFTSRVLFGCQIFTKFKCCFVI